MTEVLFALLFIALAFSLFDVAHHRRENRRMKKAALRILGDLKTLQQTIDHATTPSEDGPSSS